MSSLKIQENIMREYVNKKAGKSYMGQAAMMPHRNHLQRLLPTKVRMRRGLLPVGSTVAGWATVQKEAITVPLLPTTSLR